MGICCTLSLKSYTYFVDIILSLFHIGFFCCLIKNVLWALSRTRKTTHPSEELVCGQRSLPAPWVCPGLLWRAPWVWPWPWKEESQTSSTALGSRQPLSRISYIYTQLGQAHKFHSQLSHSHVCTHGLTVIITDIHELTPTHGFIHTHIYTHSQSLILTFTISSHVPSHRLTLIHTQIYTSSHSQNCTHSHSLGHTLTFIQICPASCMNTNSDSHTHTFTHSDTFVRAFTLMHIHTASHYSHLTHSFTHSLKAAIATHTLAH